MLMQDSVAVADVKTEVAVERLCVSHWDHSLSQVDLRPRHDLGLVAHEADVRTMGVRWNKKTDLEDPSLEIPLAVSRGWT